MKYAYENLGIEQFESLIVFLCQRLLGTSVQGFSKGPDGGRDAKFIGTADLHPSQAAPWSGIVVIQAKHTNGYNKHFSESDFFSKNTMSTVVGYEIPKIKKLREEKNLDHYMLFSNRRLAGNAENDIQSFISEKCNIPKSSIYLCGVEQLERYFKNFPDIPKLADLDPVDSPLIISPDELAEIVEAFARHKEAIQEIINETPPVNRVSYEQKNLINNMSVEYAKAQKRLYLKETSQIQNFLAAPENIELQTLYQSVVDEFQLKILAKRKEHQTFDNIMEYLVDLLFNRDPILRQRHHKRLTRAMLFYMYWNCDIGENNDAAAN